MNRKDVFAKYRRRVQIGDHSVQMTSTEVSLYYQGQCPVCYVTPVHTLGRIGQWIGKTCTKCGAYFGKTHDNVHFISLT